MRRIAVGDIMTRNFVSVEPNDSLYACAKLMAKARVNSLIVRHGTRLIGIITSRDILWVITKKPTLDLKKTKCIDFATKKIAVIKPSADIGYAIEKMKASNFRRLPVIAKGELVGVVTIKDILAVQPDLYREMKTLMDEIRDEEHKMRRADGEWPLEGLCENCGALSELLRVDGVLLCADCREEMY